MEDSFGGLFGEEEEEVAPSQAPPVNLALLRQKLADASKFGIFMQEKNYSWLIFMNERTEFIGLKDLKALRLLSSDFYVAVSPIMERDFVFWLPKGQDFITVFPKQVVVNSAENIPVTAKSLTLDGYYSDPIPSLPPSLADLILGPFINVPILSFPPTLTHFTTGLNFKFVPKNLPLSLTHVTINDCSPEFFSSLPPSVTHLSIPSPRFAFPIPSFPPSLQHLYIERLYNRSSPHPLPPLPPALTHFQTKYCSFSEPALITPALTHLIWESDVPLDLSSSSSLLSLEVLYPVTITGPLPPSLTHLSCFMSSLSSIPPSSPLPSSLTHLTLQADYREPIYFSSPLSLPPHLVSLTLGPLCAPSLSFPLPSSLRHLDLPSDYNSLPPSFSSPPSSSLLPPLLETLSCSQDILDLIPNVPAGVVITIKEY